MDIQICNPEFDHVSSCKADLRMAPLRNGNNGVTFCLIQHRNFRIQMVFTF
jgi:hypothetical protein